jgi:electron transfer flavoprotein alpha subunit
MNIIVVAEVRSGALKKASLEVVSAALQLAESCGAQVTALILGTTSQQAKDALAQSGAHKVIAVEAAALANYSGDGFCLAVVEAIAPIDPDVVLMAHTAMGKDLVPRIAATLKTGMVSDATALHFADGEFGATKPIYAGKAHRRFTTKTRPLMATLRPGSFEATGSGNAEVTAFPATIDAEGLKSIVKEVILGGGERVPLQEARIVVSGGRGLKAPEHFRLVEDLAAAFGPGVAAVGASRAVVDAGWRPHREQVGQTGKVVAPALYIACGISGAIQHLAGMSTSKCIVAINKDKDAPIFKVADYGIVGDVFEVLPTLTEAVRAAVQH